MRALLVAAAPTAGSSELVASLAAESDLVIAVDGGGAVCLEAGVVPDVVLGDFDSLAPELLERLKSQGARIVSFPPKKDATDLELAVDEARRAGATHVVVSCATSRRLDHTLAVLGVLARASDLRPEIAEPDLGAWVLSPSGRAHLDLAGCGATVSLLALSEPVVVSVTGVDWPLDAHALQPGSTLGVSNVIAGEEGARISVGEGTLLVIAPEVSGATRARERRVTQG